MHLPYGVERTLGPVVRLDADRALPLRRVAHDGFEVFAEPVLNPFLAQGRASWQAVRNELMRLGSDPEALAELEPSLVRVDELDLVLPIDVGDYVDFYSSIHHATRVGRIFRPEGDPLFPNYRHLPVAYHGRSASVVVSGTPVRRPSGADRQTPVPHDPGHAGRGPQPWRRRVVGEGVGPGEQAGDVDAVRRPLRVAGQAQRGFLQHRMVRHQRQQLLGQHRARQGPQPGARTARQDDRVNFHDAPC